MGDDRRFTLGDFIVVLAVFVVLIALLVGIAARGCAPTRSSGPHGRSCMGNLRSIGTAVAVYEHDNNFQTPWMPLAGDTYDKAPRAHNTLREFYANEGGSTASAWWLLVHHKSVSEEHFHCPSDPDHTPRRPADGPYGFARLSMVSYGLQPCNRHDAHKAHLGAEGQGGEVPIAGDRPTAALRPGATNRLEDWTNSHYGDGGNMLRRGVSVSWSAAQNNNVGMYGNNLYRTDLDADGNVMTTGSPDGVTVHPCDSYLFWQTRYEDADSGK